MATVNAPLAAKETNLLIDNDVDSTLLMKAQEPIVSNENSNFRIAENLAFDKSNLVKALTKLPASALWLVQKYQENADTVEYDEIDDASFELDPSIEQIKSLVLLASKAYRSGQNQHLDYINAIEKLTATLQGFKYTFDDLVELTDLVVFAYHRRQLNSSWNSHTGSIEKRLIGLHKRNLDKFAPIFEAIDNNELDVNFAFLPIELMSDAVSDVVTAEQNWLIARKKLAAANTRLVLFIANQYKGGFLDFDDLVQEGQTGLLKAVDRYNHELGFQFSTYAGYWIRQAISRALTRSERVVRLPFGQMANINKVYRAKDELLTKTGREPNRAELAEYTDLSLEEINNILSISQTAMSFDGESDDEEQSFGPADFLEQQVFTPAFGTIAEKELEHILNGAIETLDTREAKVIRSHFGVNCDCEMTLQEIGNELHLTRERVRQIQVAALNKIRRSFGEQLLSFL
ncbi:MAG: RNA polymerase sigma factor RpoD/SigA [Methylococcaceae bacterium]|nr:RNA polymerase sigma factor RpoD/SigA [Methylococcaceae bacterium]